MPLSVLFFWLMTLSIALEVLLLSVGSMHCFSIPVNKQGYLIFPLQKSGGGNIRINLWYSDDTKTSRNED